MPPKRVRCSVCVTEVDKSKTLALANGTRACRSHDGVQAEAEKLAANERERVNKAVEKGTLVDQWSRQRRAELDAASDTRQKESAAWREKIYSHCWTCEAEGLEGRDFFAEVMVAMKRLELRGEFNFDNLPKKVAELMGRVRLLVPFTSRNEAIDKAVIKHVRDKRLREIVHVIGFVMLCPACATQHGFKRRFDDMMPKPTWEEVENTLPLVAGMEPLLRVLAEKKEGQS